MHIKIALFFPIFVGCDFDGLTSDWALFKENQRTKTLRNRPFYYKLQSAFFIRGQKDGTPVKSKEVLSVYIPT